MSPSSERTVRLPADLHARPAGQISLAAARFASKVAIEWAGRAIDARSVLLVMSLGATKDSEVTVRAEGQDASQAVDTLAGMLEALTPMEAAPGPASSG
jgi:phosphotransferase system HPr (HPr) family protein